jgi:hypothetical protein
VNQLPRHLCRRQKPDHPAKTKYSDVPNPIWVNQKEKGQRHVVSFVKELHPHPAVRPGMDYRSSLSWFNKELSVRKFRAIPFVSLSGKFSLSTLYLWKCYPEQVLFSLISTVYSRILKILRKRKRVDRRLLNCAFKCSIVYVITRSNWIIDRFLGMSRRTPIRKVENFIHYCVCELDENKRFVYSQAYYQANWLKFQVFRPSDKSRYEKRAGSHLRNLGFKDATQFCDESLLAAAFQISSDLWDVTTISYKKSEAHYSMSSSGSDDLLSELNEEYMGDLGYWSDYSD